MTEWIPKNAFVRESVQMGIIEQISLVEDQRELLLPTPPQTNLQSNQPNACIINEARGLESDRCELTTYL